MFVVISYWFIDSFSSDFFWVNPGCGHAVVYPPRGDCGENSHRYACWEGGLGLLCCVIVVAVRCGVLKCVALRLLGRRPRLAVLCHSGCSVLHCCVAVCCSVLYCACWRGGLRSLRCVIVVAVCCSVLQSVAVSRTAEGRCLLYCGIVVAVLCCSALQCVAVSCWAGWLCCAVVFDNSLLCCAMCCSVAMCCSSVPMFCSSVAMCCNVLQCL